jgi:HisJ family histidinol phosphate phosphatase
MADYRKSSVHCHSTLCDGKNTLQEMAGAACAQGLTTLGFSGHSYTTPDREYCMTPGRTAQYRATIAKLKNEYRGKVDILCGIEWDLLSEGTPKGFDYWIGSAHHLYGRNTGRYYEIDFRPEDLRDCINNDFDGDPLAAVEAYFAEVEKIAAKKPDILGQNVDELPPDSIYNIGYARGSLKNISGSVEQITEKQMNRELITNPLEAIQGRVPGLTILKSNNGMAALESVRLRGTTSLTSGNDPLIIVDGVLGDLTMLTSVYPTDIESFTILKDASETAQYGSRGASGVINIVTKKGRAGKTRVNYNGSFGVSHAYRRLDMLSGAEYRKLAAERGWNILDKGYDTDFQKAIEQTGLQQNHNIAFYGGGEASNYRVSLGFQNREGVIQNEGMKLFTANMNMSQKMLDGLIDCELGLFGSMKLETR